MTTDILLALVRPPRVAIVRGTLCDCAVWLHEVVCRDGWMGGWIDGWMDGWLDGWMDRWMDGWMVGWVDGE